MQYKYALVLMIILISINFATSQAPPPAKEPPGKAPPAKEPAATPEPIPSGVVPAGPAKEAPPFGPNQIPGVTPSGKSSGPAKVVASAPTQTCATSNDPICFPQGIAAKTLTSTNTGIETPKPSPNDKNIRWITTETTITSYFAGYTTTNSIGSPTFIPPSTIYVVMTVAVTAPAGKSDSITILYDFNGHSLWGVTMSLSIVTVTLVFIVFA